VGFTFEGGGVACGEGAAFALHLFFVLDGAVEAAAAQRMADDVGYAEGYTEERDDEHYIPKLTVDQDKCRQKGTAGEAEEGREASEMPIGVLTGRLRSSSACHSS